MRNRIFIIIDYGIDTYKYYCCTVQNKLLVTNRMG